MRRIFRWTTRIVLGLVAFLALAVGAFLIHARLSVPELAGRYELKGFSAPVSIVRDRHGIPHIYAATLDDAYFAVGFVHAQDRLFQMEMQRRVGRGRTAEIVGAPAVRFDRLIRTLDLAGRARTALAALPAESRRGIDAYTAGVNAYLAARRESLPPEFVLVGTPEPWTAEDSILFGKLMAVQLSTGWRHELLRAKLVEALGAEKAAVFFPPYPEDGPSTLKPARAAAPGAGEPARAALPAGLPAGLAAGALWASLPESWRRGGLSNEWVVSGALTESGKPILANDPHLSLDAPTLWYLVHIEVPGFTISGATVPGAPFHIIGHNGRIAWGVTTPYVDAEDIFIEKIDPADAAKYLIPGGSEAFRTRTETIKVRFGSDVTFTVRETRNGPVLDDALMPNLRPKLESGHVLTLKAPWLAAEDASGLAFARLNRARNWDEFRAALSLYVAPAQNFVYADVDGHIGYILPGRVPLRKSGKGALPTPGWTGEGDWTGYVPFYRMPQAFDPPGGMLVNANNRIVGAGYPHFLSDDWGDHWRAARIEALLSAGAKQTLDSTAAIQGDRVSLMARDLLPLMLEAKPASNRARAALERLKAWDGTMARERAEPLIFVAWLVHLNRRLLSDKIEALARDIVRYQPDIVRHVLTRHRDWCDNTKTPAREDCPTALGESLEAALADLADRYGGDMAAWRWGTAHPAVMRHRLFGFIPVPLIRDFGSPSIEADGEQHTVNKAAMNVSDRRRPYAARLGPGVRAIYDLADLKRSRFILSTGPSGHPMSKFYDSMVQDWRDIRSVTFAPDRAAAERGGAGTIELVPAK
jgi:penicillin G amidase